MKPPKLRKPLKMRVLADGEPRISHNTGKEMIVYVCPVCYAFSSNKKHIKECCQKHFECLSDKWGKLVDFGIELK